MATLEQLINRRHWRNNKYKSSLKFAASEYPRILEDARESNPRVMCFQPSSLISAIFGQGYHLFIELDYDGERYIIDPNNNRDLFYVGKLRDCRTPLQGQYKRAKDARETSHWPLIKAEIANANDGLDIDKLLNPVSGSENGRKCTEPDGSGVAVPIRETLAFETIVTIYQNMMRRVYHKLDEEDEAVQIDMVAKIKETAVLLMMFGERCTSTYNEFIGKLEANKEVFEDFLRRRNRWRDYNHDQIRKLLTSDYTTRLINRGRLRSRLRATGIESTDLELDLLGQCTEEIIKDYRERLVAMPIEDYGNSPLIIGVLTSGLYYAATFYAGLRFHGSMPELAIVKKARGGRLSMLRSEEETIRESLAQERKIIVVDDIAETFNTLFEVFDYFHKPKNMVFSAGVYLSPIPEELDVIERVLFEVVTANPTMYFLLDGAAKESLANIWQYGIGLTRKDRQIQTMPPVNYAEFNPLVLKSG